MPSPLIKKLYEDKDILVINKPAGLSVHSDGRTKEKTLVDWLLKNYPKIKGVGEPDIEVKHQILNTKSQINYKSKISKITRPGIVHRLDRDTSGVLVIAKTPKSHEKLKKQFKEHSVEKKYVAVVYGHMKKDAGIIIRPIGKSAKDFRLRSAFNTAKGELRQAETYYKVTARLMDEKTGEKYSLLEIRPKTGRTHQIRVHLQSEGYPVVCDSLYAPGKPCPKGINRHALHAGSISLSLSGKKVAFEAPIAKDMAKFLANLTAL